MAFQSDEQRKAVMALLAHRRALDDDYGIRRLKAGPRRRKNRRLAKVLGLSELDMKGVRDFRYRDGYDPIHNVGLGFGVVGKHYHPHWGGDSVVGDRLNELLKNDIYVARQDGAKHVARHEVGHHVWTRIPAKAHKKIAKVYGLDNWSPEDGWGLSEMFADSYALTRKKGKHARPGAKLAFEPDNPHYVRPVVLVTPEERLAVAIALKELRKQRRKRK